MRFSYDSLGNAVAILYNGTEYYYMRNLQGDVIGLINKNGEWVVRYRYDVWGNILEVSGIRASTLGAVNPFRYRGYFYDAETGFYYVSSRYYDSEVGRFISPDGGISDIGGNMLGYNMYTYCFNNPVNMADPDGNWPDWVTNIGKTVKNVVNTVVSKVKSVVSSVKNTILYASKEKTNGLPTKGQPGSSQTMNNPDGTPKQKRWYGPEGNAERDRDYNHSGNIQFPHDHVWEDGKRGKEHLPPSPNYEFSLEPLLGIGLIGVCFIGMLVVVADDFTGIGVADNGLMVTLSAGIGKGLLMIFP